LACCARGRVVLYRCQGRPPNSPSPLRSPQRCAWLSYARKRSVRVVIGVDLQSLSLSLSLSVIRKLSSTPRYA
jgi:hypothetical protein